MLCASTNSNQLADGGSANSVMSVYEIQPADTDNKGGVTGHATYIQRAHSRNHTTSGIFCGSNIKFLVRKLKSELESKLKSQLKSKLEFIFNSKLESILESELDSKLFGILSFA